ncbi:hypothetical protein Ddc_06267 [Ditylenchus destructor]|nr:hypothetical protein Ddc_06267 [Ditylenchus destructor]
MCPKWAEDLSDCYCHRRASQSKLSSRAQRQMEHSNCFNSLKRNQNERYWSGYKENPTPRSCSMFINSPRKSIGQIRPRKNNSNEVVKGSKPKEQIISHIRDRKGRELDMQDIANRPEDGSQPYGQPRLVPSALTFLNA